MASWLRNVQEKLENVASSIDRVVQEAASEVTMNPEVEIEVYQLFDISITWVFH